METEARDRIGVRRRLPEMEELTLRAPLAALWEKTRPRLARELRGCGMPRAQPVLGGRAVSEARHGGGEDAPLDVYVPPGSVTEAVLEEGAARIRLRTVLPRPYCGTRGAIVAGKREEVLRPVQIMAGAFTEAAETKGEAGTALLLAAARDAAFADLCARGVLTGAVNALGDAGLAALTAAWRMVPGEHRAECERACAAAERKRYVNAELRTADGLVIADTETQEGSVSRMKCRPAEAAVLLAETGFGRWFPGERGMAPPLAEIAACAAAAARAGETAVQAAVEGGVLTEWVTTALRD